MKFLKNTLIFFLTSFCMILVMEFYFTQTEMIENLSPEPNKKSGIVYSKSQNFTFFSEGFGMGQVNSQGFLGKEYSVKTPSNTFRIAVLGDSYVQGLQVLQKDHFVNQLENKLNQETKKQIEILNFGISGYSLTDMYIYHENKVKHFKPDLLLYFVDKYDLQLPYSKRKKLYPSVDIQNNTLKINYDFAKEEKFKMYFKLKSFFSLNYTKIVRNLYFLNTQQKLSILFDKLYFPLKRKQKVKIVTQKEVKIPKVNKLILQELKKQNTIIVYRDTINDSTMDFIENQVGLSVINLNDTLNAMKKNDIDPNYWKVTKQRGHWNGNAHKAVGLFLADKIQQMNLLAR